MVRELLWASALVHACLLFACDSSSGLQDAADAEPQDAADAEPQDAGEAGAPDAADAEPQDGGEAGAPDAADAEPQDAGDPRWSGPTRVMEIERTFQLVNSSSDQAITVHFDTPDIAVHMNAIAVERTTSHPVLAVTAAANGMDRVQFEIELPPGGEDTLVLGWEVTLQHFDALAIPEPPAPLDPDDAVAYVAPSTYVQSDHPSIQAAAQQAVAGLADDLAKVQAITDFVRDHLDYEVQPETRGALWALENGRGDCTEYAALGVALARALGIPARVTGVENMVGASGSSTYDNHNAAEIWVDDYGWLPVDINYPQSPVGALPIRCAVMRWGIMAERDLQTHSVSWYTWHTTAGPTGQLDVQSMQHHWNET